jgi:hypothetical protein
VNTEPPQFALEDFGVFDLRHVDGYLFLVEQASMAIPNGRCRLAIA